MCLVALGAVSCAPVRRPVIPGTYNALFIFPDGFKGIATITEAPPTKPVDNEIADFDVNIDSSGHGTIPRFSLLTNPKNPGSQRDITAQFESGTAIAPLNPDKPNQTGFDFGYIGRNHTVFVGTYAERQKSDYGK